MSGRARFTTVASVAPPSDFEVPADRPHFAFWPKRLPRAPSRRPRPRCGSTWRWPRAAIPAKAATLFFGRAKSYAALRAEAEALAGWLQAQGVRRGDRVALFMQNCPQFVVAYHAILRADAVVVPVNAMNKAEEFGHYIVDPGTQVVICSAELAGIVASANAALPPAQRVARVLATRYADELPDGRSTTTSRRRPRCATGCSPTRRCRRAPCAGATRWPKAMRPGPTRQRPGRPGAAALHLGHHRPAQGLHAHAPHADGQRRRRRRMGFAAAPRASCWASCRCSTSPACSTACISPMFTGATVVVMPRWDRELAGRLISRHTVSHWTCIPTMIIDLFASPNYRQFDLSSLRWLSGGGAAMPQAVAQRLQRRVRPALLRGLRPHRDGRAQPRQSARAAPSCSAWASRSSASTRASSIRVTLAELPPGEVGEIVTRGPMVFTGYWSHPRGDGRGVRRARRPRAVFRTGDLGRMDDEGYFFITDRLKRMINASGFKVWPSEVELLLYKHPGGAGGLRHLGAATPTAARRSRPSSCCAPRRRGKVPERGHRRLGARAHGGLQGAAHRGVRRRAAQVRRRAR